MSDLSQILGQPVALQLVEKTGKSRYTKTNEIPSTFAKTKKSGSGKKGSGQYFLKFYFTKYVNITKQGEYLNIFRVSSRFFVKADFRFGKKYLVPNSVRIYIHRL